MTAFPKTLFWTNPFIFLFLAPPTSPISSSPRALDASFSRRIWSAHIVKFLLILGITTYLVTTGTIFYILIWFFLSACIRPPSLANAIVHIFYSVYHHQCVSYIDDFGGVEASHPDALVAFQDLENLFNNLGLESSPAKDCPPSTRMVFLGLIYNTVTMTLEVPEDKLSCATELIRHWLNSPCTTKSDLQSLIGKLSYICACISPGKIFMQRMNSVSFPTNLPASRLCSPICAGGTSFWPFTMESLFYVPFLGYACPFLHWRLHLRHWPFFQWPFLPLLLSNFHQHSVTVHCFTWNVGCHR